jgi:hypothetical protein
MGLQGVVMASAFNDLAEHTGTLLTLLGGLAIICGGLISVIYRKLNSGVADIKADTMAVIGDFKEELSKSIGDVGTGLHQHLEDAAACQKSLPKLYLNKDDGDRQIALLFSRQNDLRERTLPQDYVRRTEMEALSKSMTQLIDRGFGDMATRIDKLSDRLDKNLELKISRPEK